MRRISNVPVHSKVYDQLRNAIMAGQFEPGEAVTIRDLADQLGVSNTPVREALRRLIAEHALESLPNRSVRVPKLSRKLVDDLIKVRILVEGEAALLAAKNSSLNTVQKLERIKVEEIELTRKSDIVKLKQNNQRFHFALYEACDNPILMEMIPPLWMRYASIFNVRRLLDGGDTEKGCFSHHDEVIEAFKKGDAGTVRKAIIGDITDGTKTNGFWEQFPE